MNTGVRIFLSFALFFALAIAGMNLYYIFETNGKMWNYIAATTCLGSSIPVIVMLSKTTW